MENKYNKEGLVSIGMPIFNGEKYLEEAIISLLSQTYTNLELVISDNCSNDSTKNICLKYQEKDSRIIYFRQDNQIDVEDNFQFVLERSTGDFFMWAADDDTWDREWIERLAYYVERNSSPAFGVVQYTDSYGNHINSTANLIKFNFTSNYSLMRRLAFVYLPSVYGKMILLWGMYPRELLMQKTIQGYKHNRDIGADLMWVFEMLSICRFYHTPGVVFYKRVHGESDDAVTSNRVLLNRYMQRPLLRFMYKLHRVLLDIFTIKNFFAFYRYGDFRERLVFLGYFPFGYVVHVLKTIVLLLRYKLTK